MNQSPYTETLLNHYKNSVFFGDVEGMQFVVEHRNRSCGDRVLLGINVDAEAGRVVGIRHESDGCMLCKASASILCQSLAGATVLRAKALREFVSRVCDLEVSESELDFESHQADHDLRALLEIRSYPTRMRCVTLTWEALDELLKIVSTTTK